MQKKHHKFLIGVITIYILYNLLSINRQDSVEDFLIIESEFNQIDGIEQNSEVRISGMKIGKVISMEIKNNKPNLKLGIKKNLNIPEDSSLSIQTDGLFGKKYLSLEPGGSEIFLKNSEKIFLTEDSILVQDLLQKIIQIGNSKKVSNEK
mgnify:FL=1|tara:strand:+ start:5503 stop:5952 length:450 start_codon:yes stop_codon:yes gene_type:complete